MSDQIKTGIATHNRESNDNVIQIITTSDKKQRVASRILQFFEDMQEKEVDLTTLYTVENYIEYNTGRSKQLFICSICDRKQDKRSNMNNHVKFHLQIKNFKCRYCQKAFVQGVNRDIHQKKASCLSSKYMGISTVWKISTIEMKSIISWEKSENLYTS